MTNIATSDWGEASTRFDAIAAFAKDKDLTQESEAQTRFDVIDRFVREVLGWTYGQIKVEERDEGEEKGFVDYLLLSGDHSIVIEAKRAGATFPSPTKRRTLKMSGSVLGSGEISAAISQARRYALSKSTDIAIVTNGFCWCYFSPEEDQEEAYASLLFPLQSPRDAEDLFDLFSVAKVDKGSLGTVRWIKPPRHENRLLYEVLDSGARVDRNNIADHIAPALNNAFYADALLNDAENLELCFVKTEARVKFDNMLGVYLVDPKPEAVKPAKRIKKNHTRSHLEALVQNSDLRFAPPVTLIIGSVGVGKSTYLKHFELVSGRELLNKEKVHWIYVDFEKMGRGGNPRDFLYKSLRDYLLKSHSHLPTDYRDVVEPAYREEIAGLARGPYAPIAAKSEQFNTIVANYIANEYQQVEPYVDKIFRFISNENMAVVVMDNVDLYEDDDLENRVFSEGLALSKRIKINVIVCIRDKTYIKHRNSSAFNAFELRKLWLDPPPFEAVLSKRLALSRKILEKKQAVIELDNGVRINVPDLSVFFDIVQKSLLSGQSGNLIDALADENIRKGLTLVTNFLTSGHIQADKAVSNYLKGDYAYQFPFHEVFKGTVLGQWKYFKEERADCLNIFDSHLGSKSLRLLRLFLLRFIMLSAQDQSEVEVPVAECIDLFSQAGASEEQILQCLNYLYEDGVVRNVAAEKVRRTSTLAITRRGAYLTKILSKSFVYVEECMYDTAIEDEDTWQELRNLTDYAERQRGSPAQLVTRKQRIELFMNYLQGLERRFLDTLKDHDYLALNAQIRKNVLREVGIATAKAIRFR